MSDFKFQSNACKIEVNNLNKQREHLIYQRFCKKSKTAKMLLKPASKR